MTARHSPPFNLTDFDLKLLRVFQAVVQCQGLAPAQESLGLSLPTISTQLKQLEERLGFTLCERGRKGFMLTEEGERIYHSLSRCFDSVAGFQDTVDAVRGQLGGELRFALVDALSTHRGVHLVDGFERFAELAYEVRLIVDIASPQELLHGLTEGRYHCILTPVEPHHDGIEAVRVFSETQRLYCSDRHPLFDEHDPDTLLAALPDQVFTGRSYMPHPQLAGADLSAPRAIVSHMESAALLILSGRYLGYLPRHLGDRWATEGRMRALLPESFTFANDFHLAILRQQKTRTPKAFYECMRGILQQY